MKIIAIGLFWTSFMFSQIAERPLNFKKINFVYETKSNYDIDNQNVYADTLLFNIDFPNLKHLALDNSSKNKTHKGYIPLKNFVNDDLKKLKGILYHVNEQITGEYDKNLDETILKVVRNDEATKRIFKEYLHERYHYFEYKIRISYKKNKIQTNYPLVSYTNTIEESNNKIVFKNDTLGFYKKILDNIEYKNVVKFNSKLDPKIVPDDTFSNNTSGVMSIEKIGSTTILKSINYLEK
jgi:hypothetical protein